MNYIVINIDSNNWQYTSQGFLKIPAYISRTGVFEYGTQKELRSDEHVFSEKSLKTLDNCPITIFHKDMINTENHKIFSVGHVESGSVVRDGIYIKANLIITDSDAIKKIKNRDLLELSAGYTTIKQDSNNKSEYDYIQTEIEYNHVALLPKNHGRAGNKVRILDSKDLLNMHKFTINSNGKTIEMNFDSEQSLKDFEEYYKTLQKNLGELQVKLDSHKQVDVNTLINEKLEIIEKCKKVGLKDFDIKKDSKDLMIQAIKLNSQIVLDSNSDINFIKGMFTVLSEKVEKPIENKDSNIFTYEDMIKRNQNLYNKGDK
jgi:hypothetical protein